MNVFDIGIILVLLMYFIVGFKRGIIKEFVSLIGIIIVFLLSFSLKGILGNFFCKVLPFFTFSGILEGMSIINIFLYQAIAFFIIFSILLGIYGIVVKLSKILQKIVNLTIILILPSKILGGILSLIEAYILLFAFSLFLIIPLKEEPIYKESRMINQILYETPILSTYTSRFTTSIGEVYELANSVSKGKMSSSEANEEALDIMLKYNIVSKKLIEELKNSGKLKDVNNIESILERY